MREYARQFMTLLISCLLGYAALTLIVFLFQRSLLYYPDDSEPSAEFLQRQQLAYWPSADDYRGLASRNPPAAARGTVIVFHGNAGAAFHRGFYAEALARQNLRVILAEYPGYGGRSGDVSETALVGDALETLRLVQRMYGEPIYLWGESLGSGVASSTTHKTEVPIAGLVLFLPWDSLANLARRHYWYLPTRWLLRDRYNSVDNLLQFGGKVAVLLAANDEIIPVAHGKNLFQSIKTVKKLWVFEGAGHNSVPIAADLEWWQEVGDFISR